MSVLEQSSTDITGNNRIHNIAWNQLQTASMILVPDTNYRSHHQYQVKIN